MNIIAISYWIASAMVLAILCLDGIPRLKNIRLPRVDAAIGGATIVALVTIAAVGLFVNMIGV